MDTDDNDDIIDSEEELQKQHGTQRKFVFFENCLDCLFQFCPQCCQPVLESEVVKVLKGSFLSVNYTCSQGHANTWHSQPLLNRMPAGNLLLSAAILFSGSTYSKFAHLAHILNLSIMVERTYHSIQAKYLFPIVHETWMIHQEIYARLRGQQLKLSGDGRCDSPGYNAKCCTYTIMTQESGEFVDFHIVQVTETTSSVAMEKEAFKRCIEDLQNADLDVQIIATDHHAGIAALCWKEYPHIDHQFDIWYVTKGVMKKLTKA